MKAGWTVSGTVVHGRRLGHTLGFPTANIEVSDDWGAPDGVYRARVSVDGAIYDAMSNLGRNPSVGGCRRRLETHLFGFDGDLYGRTLRVGLLEKIRDERTFPSVESLGRQLAEDRATILQRIGSESVSK